MQLAVLGLYKLADLFAELLHQRLVRLDIGVPVARDVDLHVHVAASAAAATTQGNRCRGWGIAANSANGIATAE